MELGHGLRLAVIFSFFLSVFLFWRYWLKIQEIKKKKNEGHEKSSFIESFFCCHTCHPNDAKTLNLKAPKSSVRYLH